MLKLATYHATNNATSNETLLAISVYEARTADPEKGRYSNYQSVCIDQPRSSDNDLVADGIRLKMRNCDPKQS